MSEDGNDWPWRLVGILLILSVLAMSVATVAYIAAYLVQT